MLRILKWWGENTQLSELSCLQSHLERIPIQRLWRPGISWITWRIRCRSISELSITALYKVNSFVINSNWKAPTRQWFAHFADTGAPNPPLSLTCSVGCGFHSLRRLMGLSRSWPDQVDLWCSSASRSAQNVLCAELHRSTAHLSALADWRCFGPWL